MADVEMSDASVDKLVLEARAWPPEHMELMRKLFQNVVDNPGDAKFRKLKLTNARIGALFEQDGARQGFDALGWVMSEAGDGLELPAAADLGLSSAVLAGTVPPAPGEMVSLTVLRGPLKSKLELPSTTFYSGLAAAIEQSDSLGRIPRKRQRLLIGVPPKPLEQSHPNFASMTIADLGLKAFKLEDTWDELVADLRAVRATFYRLAPTLSCKKTLQDNRDFLLESALSLLKARGTTMDAEELKAARQCFNVLWPPGVAQTREARVARCVECTALSISRAGDGGSGAAGRKEFAFEVDRGHLFETAIAQVDKASPEQLHSSLQVTFKDEAAEDAGGPRREFFNDFGRACCEQGGVWQTTAAGSLTPVTLPTVPDSVFRNCGRIYGLALCQAENAAQEQTIREGATLAELLATVRETEDEEPQQQQKLLVGAPLSRSFLRAIQVDTPETVQEFQADLNTEQSESAADFRGSAAFVKSSLSELGLEGQLTFSRETADGSIIDLMPNGRNIVVTDATKLAWLKATLRYELVDSLAGAAQAFRAGMVEVAGAAYLTLLSASELSEEWSGRGQVTDEDLKLWQSVAKVNPARKQQAAWFFEVLWDEQLRHARPSVLKFTTGSDRWPVDAKAFSFSVEPMDGGDDQLPRAMTCGNMVQLPNYSKKEILQQQLLKACEMGLSMQLV